VAEVCIWAVKQPTLHAKCEKNSLSISKLKGLGIALVGSLRIDTVSALMHADRYWKCSR